jgi:hypothetical protein
MKHSPDSPSKKSDPIPELGYESPGVRSPFQEACIEIVKAFLSVDLDPREWIYKSELHVAIPLISACEVNSHKVECRPDFATHFGIKIGPQGFAETGWMSKGEYLVEDDQIYLRHPAEILEIALVHTHGPFCANRAEINENMVVEPMRHGDERIYLCDTAIHEFKLNPQYVKIHERISDLIDDVFVLLEEEPHKGRLLPLTKLSELPGGAKLLNILEENACDKRAAYSIFPFWDTKAPYGEDFSSEWEGNFSAFQAEANQIANDISEELQHVSYHDVILGFQYDLTSVQLLGVLHHHSVGAPKLVLRPNRSKISLLRFLDLLTTTHNPSEVFNPLAGWRKKSKNLKAEIEKSPLDQIRASLSFRQTIQRYGINTNLSTYDALVGFHGYDSTNSNTLDERERHIHSLGEAYTEFIESGYKRILAPPEPRLPHFLEIAYQRFLDSSNECSLSAHGRNFLNLLGRSLLFFMLEDVAAAGMSNPDIQKISDELQGNKPLSDGRFLDLQLKLIQLLPDEAAESLATANLMNYLPEIIENHLRPIVIKRNRANHQPFDEAGFIEEAQKQFTPAVESLRRAFRTLELLVPVHFKSKDGEITVRAQSLTGRRFEYPQRDFLTTLGHEATPCDRLLLCRVIPNQSQPPAPKQLVFEATPQPAQSQESDQSSKKSKLSIDFSTLLEPMKALFEARQKLLAPRIIQAVPLETFFNKKSGYKEVLMTGVFDRQSKDGPIYDYVEEAGL